MGALLSLLLFCGLLGTLSYILHVQNTARTYLVNLVLVLRDGDKYGRVLASLTESASCYAPLIRKPRLLLQSIDPHDVEMGFLTSQPHRGVTGIEEAAVQLWRHQTTSAEIEPHALTVSPSARTRQSSAEPGVLNNQGSNLCLIGLVLVARESPFPDGETSHARFALSALQDMTVGAGHCYHKLLKSYAPQSEAEVLLAQLRAITD